MFLIATVLVLEQVMFIKMFEKKYYCFKWKDLFIIKFKYLSLKKYYRAVEKKFKYFKLINLNFHII